MSGWSIRVLWKKKTLTALLFTHYIVTWYFHLSWVLKWIKFVIKSIIGESRRQLKQLYNRNIILSIKLIKFLWFLYLQMLLPIPLNCPREIFDLMCECWQRNESSRPNFREIHLFLQRKNLGYKPIGGYWVGIT